MSCPKTEQLLSELFADELTDQTRKSIHSHINGCSYCQEEYEQGLAIESSLRNWEEVPTPIWDRGANYVKAKPSKPDGQGWTLWQWLPTASSFAMLCIVLFNTTISADNGSFSISFGTPSNSQSGLVASEIENLIAQRLQLFEAEQSQQINTLVARMEDRQDSNNLRLMQAVLEQSEQATNDSLQQVLAYIDQQREFDLQTVQVSYQELADSGYETIRSLQQLANFVSYQGEEFDSVTR